MAPKKSARGVAQVRLSTDAEKKLTRLVENVSKPAASGSTAVDDDQPVLKKQAEKRLRKIYDSLGDEGFTTEQIQLVLAAIPVARCTLETALDWLCLHIPPNELPIKYSSGFTVDDTGGSVQVLASSSGEKPATTKSSAQQDEFAQLSRLDSKQSRQSEPKADKDWIRQYVAQQEEEDESDTQSSDHSDWEDRIDIEVDSHRSRRKTVDPEEHAKQIAAAFACAKQAAAEAKVRGDKQRQGEASKLIRDLKEEMAYLGLNEQDLASRFPQQQTTHTDEKRDDSDFEEPVEEVSDGEIVNTDIGAKAETEEDEELMGLFNEDSAQEQSLPTAVLKLHRKDELLPWGMEAGNSKSRKKCTDVKGDEVRKSPRAVLQQYCSKNGWDAPKYEKLSGRIATYNYAITIFRPGSGRGKQKKAGGPISFNLPEEEDVFDSISDAQDAVATWALFSLFPEIPVYVELLEPFRSLWLRWHDQGKAVSEPDAEARDQFINSLLDSDSVSQASIHSEPLALNDVKAPENINTSRKPPRVKGEKYDQAANSHLKYVQNMKWNDQNYQKMLAARNLLPIASVKEKILNYLATNNVLVVSGETGSGKTTQVPQYIMDDLIAAGRGGSCKIICTQPRRIAAISVAERVAVERCEPAPGEPGSLVGYQVRLDTSWSVETRLLFCTTGILLRRLASDRELSDISHVVVDEVHERTVLGDFLITLLKDLLEKRSRDGCNPLKVILMSATLDADRFSGYFGGCPVVIAQGRTFPVKTFYLENIYEQLSYRLSSDNPAAITQTQSYDKRVSSHLVDKSRGRQNLASKGWGDEKLLENTAMNPLYDESLYYNYSENTKKNLAKVNEDVIDYELLEDLVIHINETAEPGALLVFLPGMPEIHQLLDRLLVLKAFSGPASEWLLPLHSSVAPADQRKVFQTPPNEIRKIILSTNIAETSVTIEDVVHVIDCGKHKENRFDPRRRMSRMMEAWISQANAQQRKGRAGRVKPGYCFCLYTENRFKELMRPFQLPEILRVPLVELCLQIKLLAVGDVASFLQKALDPPKVEAVESAMSILREVGAVTEEESITALGYHLAALPVDVHIGKMMLYGVLLGCLGPTLTIAAYLSHKSPFVAPIGQRDGAERAKLAFCGESSVADSKNNIASKQQSDHLVIVAAYNNWRRIVTQGGARAARQFCDSNFLSVPVLNMLREMRIQFANLLRDIGFIAKDEYERSNADRWLDDVNRLYNRNAQSPPVIKSVLCAGLYPNLAVMMEESVKAGHANALNQRAGLSSEKRPRWTDGRREVVIHPSSVNAKVKEFQHPYLVYHEKVETTRVYLRDTTVLSPFSVLLFGGSIKVQHQLGHVTLDGWMKMDVPARTAVLVKELRISLDLLLDELTKSPQGLSSARSKEVVTSVLELLVDVDQDRNT